MAGYSALFSAGLLAPSGFGLGDLPKTPSKDRATKGSSGSLHIPIGDSSPIRPVSPLPRAHSESDTDTDIDLSDHDMDTDFKRDITPTQQSVARARAGSGSSIGTMPRLRRRRSSLTVATSPMNVIRSPIRTAGNALHLQRAISRSRSGSLASSPPTESVFNFFGGGQNEASHGTSLMGRLRSGSVGAALSHSRPPPPPGAVHGRIRRYLRRTSSMTPGPAPAPPPTAPLPDVPPVPALPSLSSLRLSMPPNRRGSVSFRNDAPKATVNSNSAVKPTKPTRDRGLSVSSNVETIDEEMKEF
ncbi:hypothetical protein BKA70DRAFT_464852 [Coprinopsis sp. MPI-PUGE-AT-0042]|nr:hypothetical protein BKA70DRAFT_464852 [Coprinopsis sp. MPI-PUGE-AT-0042]